MANQLAGEISPYLLQHQDNPVHWLPWGEAVFDLAQRQHKPVLVSIGYAACHWCHVMAHESFEDPAVAEILNKHFICIKVDREEHPHIDAIYMQALQLMQIPGGWPLNMFVTPAGKPFFGGTYFPPHAMQGRPSFTEVLHYLIDAWRDEQDKIVDYTESMQQALMRIAETAPRDLPDLSELETRAAAVLNVSDLNAGGLQGAPKFPQLPLWLTILSIARHHDDSSLRDMVNLTATALCQGGIYDHLGGGLARYATDADWLIPHFEKMLYDNALFIELLSCLYVQDFQTLYRERVTETINWLQRDMLTTSGGLASSLDADSEGEEGKYYIWSAAEIKQILGSDAELFMRAYEVSETGNWEGRNILHRRHAAILTAMEEQRLSTLCAKLLVVRQRRMPPGRDDKTLTDWNGLAIAALTRAAMVFERSDWLQMAISIYESVLRHLADGGHLLHAYRAGQARQHGLLEDYAAMILAALTLYQASGMLSYLQQAETWAATVELEFSDQKGGYFTAHIAATDLIVRLKAAQDQAMPAGNGLMAFNLAQLYYLSGKAVYRERTERVLKTFAEDLSASPMFYGYLLRAMILLARAKVVVICGGSHAMVTVAWQAKQPDSLVIPCRDTAELSVGHPAYGKVMQNQQSTAYICEQQTCGYPIIEIEQLKKALS